MLLPRSPLIQNTRSSHRKILHHQDHICCWGLPKRSALGFLHLAGVANHCAPPQQTIRQLSAIPSTKGLTVGLAMEWRTSAKGVGAKNMGKKVLQRARSDGVVHDVRRETWRSTR